MAFRYLQYLGAAADRARQQWTQFNMPLMLLGLLLLTACLLLQAYTLWHTLPPIVHRSPCLQPQHWKRVLPAGAVGLVGLHAIGLFSTNFILGEGRMVCFLVACFAVLLLHSTLAALMQHHALQAVQSPLSCSMTPADGASSPASAVSTEQTGKDSGAALEERNKDGKAAANGALVNLTGESGRQVAPALITRRPLPWNRNCSKAVACGVGLLGCNALLGSLGLVVRTGHDAMHKAAAGPASEANVAFGHSMHTGQHDWASRHWPMTAVVLAHQLVAPVVNVMLFPLLLLDGATSQNSMSRGWCGLVACLEALTHASVWCLYTLLAVYWLLVNFHLKDIFLAPQVEQTFAAISRTLPFSLVSNTSMKEFWSVAQLGRVAMLKIPAVLFLASLVVMLLLICSRAISSLQEKQQPSKEIDNQKGNYTLLATLAVPVLLVSGSENSVIGALGLLECACATELLRLLASCWKHNGHEQCSEDCNLSLSSSEAWLGVAEGCLWALLSMQLFFCTGHFCEFAGLQYSAGNSNFCLAVSLFWHSSSCTLALACPVCGMLNASVGIRSKECT